jgi:8-oxo-dGTP pyrophosphatase MutT (NUDIX family)
VPADVQEPIRHRPGGAQVILRPDTWRLGGAPPWARDEVDLLPIDSLLQTLAGMPARQMLPAFPDARDSAVLVLLHEGEHGTEVLFTRRSLNLRTHRGEISFPGGRMEPGEDPVDAALREAAEEVGLDRSSVTVHGELDHLSTVVSNSYIVPVVATVDHLPELVAAPGEVDRILWLSLGELSRPDTFREEWWGAPPRDRPIFFFEVEDETIWGATGRMLHQLLRLAHGLDVPEPPVW